MKKETHICLFCALWGFAAGITAMYFFVAWLGSRLTDG